MLVPKRCFGSKRQTHNIVHVLLPQPLDLWISQFPNSGQKRNGCIRRVFGAWCDRGERDWLASMYLRCRGGAFGALQPPPNGPIPMNFAVHVTSDVGSATVGAGCRCVRTCGGWGGGGGGVDVGGLCTAIPQLPTRGLTKGPAQSVPWLWWLSRKLHKSHRKEVVVHAGCGTEWVPRRRRSEAFSQVLYPPTIHTAEQCDALIISRGMCWRAQPPGCPTPR